MSDADPAEAVESYEEEIAGGVTLEYTPLAGGQIRLTTRYKGDPLQREIYNTKIFESAQLKREYLGRVEEKAAGIRGIDASVVREELDDWFTQMADLDQEEQADVFLTNEIRAILEGTEYPVEVYGGETTTWEVTVTFNDMTKDLEFTADEMVGDSAGPLKQKMANQFYEIVDIEDEDWEAIRERWQAHKEVVAVVEETGTDSVADRVVEYLSNNLLPVEEREKMGNDNAAAWYDATNATGYDDAPATGPILWVQDSFLMDQLENAGKQIGYKGQLTKDLIARGDLYGGRVRRTWWDGTQAKVYPFKPEALRVTEEDVTGLTGDAHSEVEV